MGKGRGRVTRSERETYIDRQREQLTGRVDGLMRIFWRPSVTHVYNE